MSVGSMLIRETDTLSTITTTDRFVRLVCRLLIPPHIRSSRLCSLRYQRAIPVAAANPAAAKTNDPYPLERRCGGRLDGAMARGAGKEEGGRSSKHVNPQISIAANDRRAACRTGGLSPTSWTTTRVVPQPIISTVLLSCALASARPVPESFS